LFSSFPFFNTAELCTRKSCAILLYQNILTASTDKHKHTSRNVPHCNYQPPPHRPLRRRWVAPSTQRNLSRGRSCSASSRSLRSRSSTSLPIRLTLTIVGVVVGFLGAFGRWMIVAAGRCSHYNASTLISLLKPILLYE
jgi:hypothetical protein